MFAKPLEIYEYKYEKLNNRMIFHLDKSVGGFGFDPTFCLFIYFLLWSDEHISSLFCNETLNKMEELIIVINLSEINESLSSLLSF